ncbi:MAG: sigma-54-dependent Fis family transcriptional regulator [Magnetococcales bacterium]|nr:sigma-54-dependent Fis family transcriptional regulator [Magnetococcales bacterium]
MMQTILLVDDDPTLREVMKIAIESMGHEVLVAADGVAALACLDLEPVDLLLTDLRMPGMSGRELLGEVKRRLPQLPVVMMTAYSSVRDAVEIIKEGAFDYITKPIEMDELEATLRNALNLFNTLRDNQRLRQELAGRYRFDALIGHSDAFRQVLNAITEVCESRANVLLTGESGTGKELVARAIHFNSARRDKPFVAVNCAAIPDSLLESELFGHVKGAFTGAVANRPGKFSLANGGTLFLDEIGDMSMATQAKILRVLQERSFESLGASRSQKVDVRIIAATHKNLLKATTEGAFREDLYYRLNVFPIALPPLRARDDDILELAAHFLADSAASMGKRMVGFTSDALTIMQNHPWPGNVRELQNCIERAVIICRGDRIDSKELPSHLLATPCKSAETVFPLDLDEQMAKLERTLVLEALAKTGGIQVAAAQLLGISERSLWHRVRKHHLQVTRRVTSVGTGMPA